MWAWRHNLRIAKVSIWSPKVEENRSLFGALLAYLPMQISTLTSPKQSCYVHNILHTYIGAFWIGPFKKAIKDLYESWNSIFGQFPLQTKSRTCQLRKIYKKIMTTKDFERCPIWPDKGEAFDNIKKSWQVVDLVLTLNWRWNPLSELSWRVIRNY